VKFAAMRPRPWFDKLTTRWEGCPGSAKLARNAAFVLSLSKDAAYSLNAYFLRALAVRWRSNAISALA
jgi:hypothetical protein